MSATKLLMRWNVRDESEESEYYEFLVHEFIPGMNKLGIDDIQVWATAYGECEQKLVSGIAESMEQMNEAMQTEAWSTLTMRLEDFVDELDQKVVVATRGFQI